MPQQRYRLTQVNLVGQHKAVLYNLYTTEVPFLQKFEQYNRIGLC